MALPLRKKDFLGFPMCEKNSYFLVVQGVLPPPPLLVVRPLKKTFFICVFPNESIECITTYFACASPVFPGYLLKNIDINNLYANKTYCV